ncbi:MAG: preprotein translocase subunit YajC [Caulobacteraceae bacterium]|nr:preprotein translocase subunit YajC [Caulobacter sp.]
MFASTAQAQTPGAPAGGGSPLDNLGPFLLPVALFALFYFMVLRPQQTRARKLQETIGALKKGDAVILSGGIHGKVNRLEDVDAYIEIAPNTVIRVVRSQISEAPSARPPMAANDAAKGPAPAKPKKA